VLLAVAPWTTWWERNLFASLLPDLSRWMSSAVVRAAVSGVGLITILTGVVDLWVHRRRRPGRRNPAAAAARRDS
jgi:hypothetical protein